MDATNPMTPQNQQNREDKRRKRKAILAGGVVLGLGAAVTLAAWSDDVFADGTFNTGAKFLIEGSEAALPAPTDPTSFRAARDEGTALTLSFPTGNLSPGETVYAPLTIKTTNDSTVGGNITQVSSTADGGMAAALQYTIASGATECTETAQDGTGWIPSTGVDDQDATTSEIALGANGAAPVGLCIAVTFPEEAKDLVVTNGDSNAVPETTVTWQFHAEQNG